MSISTQSAVDFSALFNQQKGTITVLDLRTAAEVQGEYLEGCVCLPVQELTPDSFDAKLNEVGHTDEPVYLLCQSGKRAQVAVDKLQGKTQRPLVIIDGGLNGLKAAGVGVKNGGGKVISLERQVRIAAGFLVVLGVALGALVSSYLYGISAFVGAGLMFAGITDTCGMAMCLAHMPWNKAKT
ncbi:rhodanese-like domain-containing protein [Marinagarivorans algicola]|uniref:rhodanese-like domain-containing protein n=1 Tax=Marinagarivorans algicola TaxID=1513270 RepID=UPI0006B57886|nr:rhodanese-like domain-containing protein [Marinagarivorans algicola]